MVTSQSKSKISIYESEANKSERAKMENRRRKDEASDVESAGKADTIEAKSPVAKVKKNKSLPFDPEKVKAAAAASAKSKRTNTTGAKPTGVKKSTNTKQLNRRVKNTSESLDSTLSAMRRWVDAPTTYMIRNDETGCFGLSCRKPEGEQSEITIVHTEYCDCLDVRLLHVCQHVDALVKGGHIARRSRDALVIVIKIQRELPEPTPKNIHFPKFKKQVIRRRKSEMEAEDEILYVVETYNQKKLIEKWKNLKAYKDRLIWKDWFLRPVYVTVLMQIRPCRAVTGESQRQVTVDSRPEQRGVGMPNGIGQLP
ncbi:hypothetical protein O1611_g514 [Lasiodiplodia mahajangana]|uniref:Uncharacterized protein n=1 Tax=Lasiodiplodia mahajangana TaxID=1108764 RepID=A0ACC2K091_9PEZI|nr:hypothetical protein O1611_g514 [Lasiodiplodia mahajangana]